MKKLFYSSLLALATAPAFAQEIDITWDNITYSGSTFSFDVIFAPGSGYSSLTTMGGADLRFYINTGGTPTVTSISATAPTDADAHYDLTALTSIPGTPPAGSAEFGLSIALTGTDLLTTPGTPFTIATISVTLSTTIPDDATFTLLPPLPTGETSGAYSFWSYGDGSTAGFNADAEVALPVEFLSFAAQKVNNTAVLSWATAMEKNNVGFDVERSTDGRTFTKVGYVATKAAGGNSTATLNYNFKDEQPAAGVNYYRLKQRDIDGKFSFSTIASVAFGDAQPVAVYPNPANSSLTVQGVNAGNEIRFVDITGKIAMVHTAASAIETLNVSGLAAGMYVMQVWNNSTVVTSMQIAKK